MQITHVVVHTPEQAREIVREALEIADELAKDSEAWEAAFREACHLLGQRSTITVQPAPVDFGALTLKAKPGW